TTGWSRGPCPAAEAPCPNRVAGRAPVPGQRREVVDCCWARLRWAAAAGRAAGAGAGRRGPAGGGPFLPGWGGAGGAPRRTAALPSRSLQARTTRNRPISPPMTIHPYWVLRVTILAPLL